MGTYLTALITGPLVDLEKIKLKKLPDWGLDDFIPWDIDEITYHRAGKPNPETGLQSWDLIKTGDWRIFAEGNSKWANEQAYTWGEYFTSKHPTLTVTIREDWDNRDADEAGIEQRVYREGELVLGESKMNGEVPMNLSDLLDGARTALMFHVEGKSYAGSAMAAALESLIRGLA